MKRADQKKPKVHECKSGSLRTVIEVRGLLHEPVLVLLVQTLQIVQPNTDLLAPWVGSIDRFGCCIEFELFVIYAYVS